MAAPDCHCYNLSFLISYIFLHPNILKNILTCIPLKILSFLSTMFLMISAFFSSVKLINNEDDQVKEKVKEQEEEGFFNKLEFKVY